MVVSTWPDTFEVIESFRDAVVIEFSERISERPTEGRLDQAVVVSPITGEHRVKHTRQGLEISVLGGFEPGLVYRIRVLRTIKDLFNNPMEAPFELVFSTGGEYEPHVLAGVVTDRITGEPIERVRVEARQLIQRAAEDTVAPPPGPPHLALTDSAGIFVLRYLPAGTFDLTVYEDTNRNREPNFRERQGTSREILGFMASRIDTVLTSLALMQRDTTQAELIRVEAEDSTRLKISFDDYLDPEGPLDQVISTLLRDAGEEEAEEMEAGPALEKLLWQWQVDSLTAAQDSLRLADSLRAVADSLSAFLEEIRVQEDTVQVPRVERELETLMALLAPPEGPEVEGAEAETGEGEELIPEAHLPETDLFALLAAPLESGQLYRFRISGVRNINGLEAGGGEAGVTWNRPEPPPGDSAGAPGDSAAAPGEVPETPPDSILPDTAVLGPDSISPDAAGTATPPDTSAAAPETVLPETSVAAPDSVLPDTSVAAPDSVLPDTSAAAPDSVPPDTTLARPDAIPPDTSLAPLNPDPPARSGSLLRAAFGVRGEPFPREPACSPFPEALCPPERKRTP